MVFYPCTGGPTEKQVAAQGFRSWNRGGRAILLHQSKHFVSGAPSTVMGQLQLRDGKSGTWRFAGAMGQRELPSGESGTRTWGASEDGSVSRSVSVFVLRGRPGRSRGLGRLTDAGGRGRSCGPGCEARAAPSPAGRRSALAIPASPQPGDWSVGSLRWRFSSRSFRIRELPGPGSPPRRPRCPPSSVSGRNVGHNYL